MKLLKVPLLKLRSVGSKPVTASLNWTVIVALVAVLPMITEEVMLVTVGGTVSAAVTVTLAVSVAVENGVVVPFVAVETFAPEVPLL